MAGEWRLRAGAACCAALAALIFFGGKAPAADDDVSPWATGGAKTKAGDTDGKADGVKLAQIPVTQAYAWPGYVIQGGAIPKDWKPQAIPYQAIGPDGRPITMYYAPTYTFTYPVGPPMLAVSPVNRPQAYAQPQYSGWNYQATGAAPPTYALPPPNVARYQPPPYQYPASAPQLAGTPVAPPTTPLPPPPQPQQYAPPPQQYAAPQQPPLPDQWQSVQPPPTQWESAAATAAPAAMAGAAALATQPAAPAPPPPMTAVSTAPQMQPVSTSPQSAPLVPMQSQPPAGRSANSHLWRVVGVHDGDTITCLDENNQQQKIRMAEIDAPEIGQDFGKVSRDAMAGMVFGKTVEVVDDGKDRYGRWIGHVYVNGTDVNREMVATGNAWHYAAYSKDQSLADLQAQAQAQKLGLWAQPNPTPPWEFRKNGKK
jgi:endonuclease YncB( thermonuclease family)